MAEGLCALLPETGSSALIYYQGVSEPGTAGLLRCLLKPGMIFFDVGSHIGEYTLIGARSVAASGHVHAFEPGPSVFGLLCSNIQRNALPNVTVRKVAIADVDAECDFINLPDTSLSFLATSRRNLHGNRLRIATRTLDSYCQEAGIIPNLVKVDVEGAELSVLAGARSLLRMPRLAAPSWVIEYSPDTYARFGTTWHDLLLTFEGHAYSCFVISDHEDPRPLRRVSDEPPYKFNIFATKTAEQYANLCSPGPCLRE
ncbi:MAG: FkbM family methyltransferase [Bryobacteraceae bacterium]|nr:FkbM family methyltransferase [Bryobacteraceae bacterium]